MESTLSAADLRARCGRWFLKATLVWCIASILGCNEPPTEVGTALVYDTTRARQLSSQQVPMIVATSSLTTPSYLFNAGILLIGRTPELHAASLIRFTNLPDSLGWLSASNIVSARLLLRPHRYAIGDTTTNLLAFTVHHIRRQWIATDSAGSVTIVPRWNNLFSTDGVPSADYFDPEPLAVFDGSQKIPLADSLADVEIPLTAAGIARVAEWLQKMADSSQRGTIYGIGFVPDVRSTVVREFETQSPGALTAQLVRLRVVYQRRDGGLDSLLLVSGNDATFVNCAPPQGGLLPVQSIVKSEVALTLDVSAVPPLDAVLAAQLTIWSDTTQRLAGNFGVPRTVELGYTDTVTTRSLGFVGGQIAGSSRFVFPNLGPLIDYLRLHKQGRGTVVLRSRNLRLERLVFYGADAPDSLRPRLVVTYIPRPGAP